MRTTLEPILKRIRGEEDRPPTPEQILDLKVCDPAMGSGAFLVEASRQLGDALIEAWHFHDQLPSVPPDEDEVVLARRLIAQRCLYGVDRNPVAVDLAKMSLWLITLARDHPLTFRGSRVATWGFAGGAFAVVRSRRFTGTAKRPVFQAGLEIDAGPRACGEGSRSSVERIREADETVAGLGRYATSGTKAQVELERGVGFLGDFVLAAFFEGREGPKEREQQRNEYATSVLAGRGRTAYRERLDAWRDAAHRRSCPSIGRSSSQRCSTETVQASMLFVGNPPFAGKNTTGDHRERRRLSRSG